MLGFLVEILEKQSFELIGEGVELGWVSLTQHEIGVPYDVIFQAYDSIFDQKVRLVQVFFLIFRMHLGRVMGRLRFC